MLLFKHLVCIKENSVLGVSFKHNGNAGSFGIPLHRTLLLILLLGYSSIFSLPPSDAAAAPTVTLELIADGFINPVAITHAGDGSGRLFITEQNGRVLIYNGVQVLAPPFLNISSLVSCCNERGLLSVAFHPNYTNNGFFYVNYTNTSGNTVIARYTVSAANPNAANQNSALILLTITQPDTNHNGGQLQFGPDGFLYIAMGDGGSNSQTASQNPATLLGKMLRIDVNSDAFPADPNRNYSIPPGNPYVNDPDILDEIWMFGFRNPWRFSFDRLTGDMLIGDVGQNSREEIDFQPADSTGGENYGWRCYEGSVAFNLSGCGPASNYDFPILEYTHDNDNCSVTGGYRYRGSDFSDLFGYYFYGDFCTGIIWGATPDGSGVWTAEQLLDTAHLISGFGENEAGEIYVLSYSDTNGEIYRIVSVGGSASADLSVSKSDSPDPVATGANLTYSVLVRNSGPNTATGVTLTDTLPSSVTFVSASAGCTRNGTVVTCGLGSLANGATSTVTIVVRRSTAGTITNTADVTANESDSNTSNNRDTESTTVNNQTFRLTVTISGQGRVTSSPGGISCPGDCTQNYNGGTKVTLTARPNFGWRFRSWGGACQGTSTTCMVNMTTNRSVTATFSR